MIPCLRGDSESVVSGHASDSHVTPEELLRLAGSRRARGLSFLFPASFALLPSLGEFV